MTITTLRKTFSSLSVLSLILSPILLLLSCEPGAIPVSSVSISPTSLSLIVDESSVLTATVSPGNATDKSLTWSSSNPAVATVSNGKVTAIKEGECIITATTVDGGRSAKCTVTVQPKEVRVGSVSLFPTETEVSVEESVSLSVTVLPENATDKSVTWSSSDPAIATVSEGKVTGVSEGECTITVTTVDGGFTATCTVTVKPQSAVFPDEDYFKTFYWDRTDRQKAGLRGNVKAHHITKYTTYTEYIYDIKGNLIEERYVNTENEGSNVVTTHTYDDKNHRLHTEVRYPASDNFLATEITYQYENTGKYVPTSSSQWAEQLYTSGSGIPLTIYKDLSLIALAQNLGDHMQCDIYTFEFVSETQLIVTDEYFFLPLGSDIFDKSLRYEEKTYKDNVYYKDGLPYKSDYLSEVTYFPNGMIKTYTGTEGLFTFVENDHVNVFSEYNATMEPGGMLPIWWTKNTYNENMDKTDEEECCVSKDQIFHDTWRDYRYDSHGNWIEVTETVNPRWFGEAYPDKIGREISYH